MTVKTVVAQDQKIKEAIQTLDQIIAKLKQEYGLAYVPKFLVDLKVQLSRSVNAGQARALIEQVSTIQTVLTDLNSLIDKFATDDKYKQFFSAQKYKQDWIASFFQRFLSSEKHDLETARGIISQIENLASLHLQAVVKLEELGQLSTRDPLYQELVRLYQASFTRKYLSSTTSLVAAYEEYLQKCTKIAEDKGTKHARVNYFSRAFVAGDVAVGERTRKKLLEADFNRFQQAVQREFNLTAEDKRLGQIALILLSLRQETSGEFACILKGNALTVDGQTFELGESFKPPKIESITREEWNKALQRYFGLPSFTSLRNALNDLEFRLGVGRIQFQRTSLLGATIIVYPRDELHAEPIVIKTSVFSLKSIADLAEAPWASDLRKAGEGAGKEGEKLFTELIKKGFPITFTFEDGEVRGLFPSDRKLTTAIPILTNNLQQIEINLSFNNDGEKDKFLQNIFNLTTPGSASTSALEIMRNINGTISIMVQYQGQKPKSLTLPFSIIGLAQGLLGNSGNTSPDANMIQFQANLITALLTNGRAKIQFENGIPKSVE